MSRATARSTLLAAATLALLALASTPAGAALPDGRAYEQVSPVDKNGANVESNVNLVHAAPDGDAITYLSAAGVPGGEGAQNTPLFMASRSPLGWSTTGLQPPASTGPSGYVLGWDDGLTSSFTSNFIPGEPTVLYRRQGASSSVSAIASGVAEPRLAATSADGSEVAFESTAALTAGAVAGKSNVYLWDRADGAVRLASAMNDGAAPAEGASAGPYAWFGNNSGGAIGKYYTQQGNVLAVDGSRLWFTSGEGQIYLRRNPAAPQSPRNAAGECTVPADACTVHVSATQKTNGAGPGGTDLAGTRKAAFMSAAVDGSAALFTSPEKLTNDATTGPEPKPPAIARAEISGTEPPELAFLPTEAAGIAVDGSHVYWADPGSGTIGRATTEGTEVDDEFITGLDHPEAVAVDSGHIYWAAAGGGGDGEGSIGRATLEGKEGEDIVAGEEAGRKIVDAPEGIAVDSAHIYWGNLGEVAPAVGVPDSSVTQQIMRADLDGSSPEEFGLDAEGNPSHWMADGLALSGDRLYFVRSYKAAGGGEAAAVYFIETAEPSNFGYIEQTDDNPNRGGPGGRYAGMAVDGSHLYWTIPSANAVGRSSLDGTGAEFDFISGASRPQGIAVDSGHVYWSTNPTGGNGNPGNDLYRYDAFSGRLTDLTPDPPEEAEGGAEVQGVLGASADGSWVYFVANGVLASGAAPGDCVGSSGSCNLYLSRAGTTTFISRLDAAGALDVSDRADWLPTSSPPPGKEILQRTARISPDGRTLLFRSRERLTSYDNKGVPEFYLYRASAGENLRCVSCDPTGAPPSGSPRLQTRTSYAGIITVASYYTRNLTDDGRRVFFESPDRLSTLDVNGTTDVYEWEAVGTGSCTVADAHDDGCLSLISTGMSPSPSYFADASDTGDDAFFFTYQPLVGQDKDQLVDLYDARVGGGIAAQSPPPVVPCVGEACRGGAQAGPAWATPASATYSGGGNVAPRPRRPPRRRHHRRAGHHRRHHGKKRDGKKHHGKPKRKQRTMTRNDRQHRHTHRADREGGRR